MKASLALLLTTAFFVAPVAPAASVDYFTSFSATDSPAFMDGRLNDQNSWVAHPIASVSDAAGASLVNHVNANGPVHHGTSADVTSELAAGKTITLTLVLNFEGSFTDQNSGAWLLGLSNNSTGMPESASSTIGSATFQNLSNSNFWLSPVGFPLDGSKFDTGMAWDEETHTVITTLTRSATENEFDITTEIDGLSTSYVMTHEGLWSGTDTAYAGFRFRGNQAGFIDAFGVSSVGGGGGPIGESITVHDILFESGTGVTISYNSSVGAVDVYRNSAGDLSAGNFVLVASGVTGGTYIDSEEEAALGPKAFYVLVTESNLPFAP